MISLVYRRKRKTEGKTETARLYRGRYRLDGEAKITDVPLHTTDKRVAQQTLEKIVQQRQLENAGFIPPESMRNAQHTSLLNHLKDYLADLTATGRDREYIYIVEKQVQKLLEECKWTFLTDINSDSFLRWRSRQKKAPKTLNEYLASVSSLLNWMERRERIERNPLKHVQKVQTNGRQVRLRRAFTDDEMGRLLEVAGPRRIVYLMAVYTGLRRGELAKLQRTDLHLDAEQPFLSVRASTTKNHKQANIAIHPDLMDGLQSVVAELPVKENRLLVHLMPSMITFKADLKAANIEFLDGQGRRADFHSLRHTLGTNLARAGTSPRIAMEIMRHSDIKLTTKTYTDAGLLPVSDAITSLPSLGAKRDLGEESGLKTRTQIGTQTMVRRGPDGSGPDRKTAKNDELEVVANKALTTEMSGPVRTGPETAQSCRARTRT